MLETTRELDIAFVAISPVGRGGLCGELVEPAGLPERDFRRTMPRFMAGNWPANRALVDKLVALAAEAGITAAQLSLAWALSRAEHVHVIPGTTNLGHLEDNYRSADIQVGQDLLERAGALINEETVSGHRYPEAMRVLAYTEEYA